MKDEAAGVVAGDLQELSAAECFRLMSSQPIGRLGVIADGYPLIFPVNFWLEHELIVIRTGAGTKLVNAPHANVTFQVDAIDQRNHSGWSVLVRALAEEVSPQQRAALVERSEAFAPQPWAPGKHGHWLRLIPHSVTGRRIVPGQLPDIYYEAAGYL